MSAPAEHKPAPLSALEGPRALLAHDAACELDALARLALATRGTPHDDNPLLLRGLLLRMLALVNAQVSMLGGESMPEDKLQALRSIVQGAEAPLQGVRQ